MFRGFRGLGFRIFRGSGFKGLGFRGFFGFRVQGTCGELADSPVQCSR